MVFFICEVCNASLKKNKVENHCYECRDAWVFACMDCGKRFQGDEYKSHTSCISESQKYEGKFFVQKENKGDVKQQTWIEVAQKRLEGAAGNPRLKNYIERLTQYDNLPRKKIKFVNFSKNSLNLRGDPQGIAEQLWDLVKPDESSATAVATPDWAPAAAAPPAISETTGCSSSHAASSTDCAKGEKLASGGASTRVVVGGEAVEEDPTESAKVNGDEAGVKKRKQKQDTGTATAETQAESEEGTEKKKKKDKKKRKDVATAASVDVGDTGSTKPGGTNDDGGKKKKNEGDEKRKKQRQKQSKGDTHDARKDTECKQVEGCQKGAASQATGAAAAKQLATAADAADKRNDGKRKSAAGADEAAGKAPSAKKAKTEASPKPVKWKKIIIKELMSVGGSMRFKKLRTDAIDEAQAHPTHKGRPRRELEMDFDHEVTERIDKFNRFEFNKKDNVLKLVGSED
uniref:Zinc finger C2H2 LYAR-type domain-containing protein n=1 Tax=Coccolithus braarudii TaxID=221442 RepID=A0A7S0LKP1_9EUKA